MLKRFKLVFIFFPFRRRIILLKTHESPAYGSFCNEQWKKFFSKSYPGHLQVEQDISRTSSDSLVVVLLKCLSHEELAQVLRSELLDVLGISVNLTCKQRKKRGGENKSSEFLRLENGPEGFHSKHAIYQKAMLIFYCAQT